MMPRAAAEPFGETIGNWLRNPDNQLGLYVLYGGWFAITVQLLISAVAWDFKNAWFESVICYSFGLPLLISIAFNFTVLHLTAWQPPSSLPGGS